MDVKIIDIARIIIYFPKKISNSANEIEFVFLQGNKDVIDSKTYTLIFSNIIRILGYSKTFRDLLQQSNNFLYTLKYNLRNRRKTEFNQISIDKEIAFVLYIFLHYYVFFASVLEGNSRMIMKDFSDLNFIIKNQIHDTCSIEKILSIETTHTEDKFEEQLKNNMIEVVKLFDVASNYSPATIQNVITDIENKILPLYKEYLLKKEGYSSINMHPIANTDLFKKICKQETRIGERSHKLYSTFKEIDSERRQELINSIIDELLSPLPAKELYNTAKIEVDKLGLLNLSDLQLNNTLKRMSYTEEKKLRSYVCICKTYEHMMKKQENKSN